ncbi:sugar phosphate isomerase/epimerase family protein [Phytoactinopolyspora halotolerans]|uniref:Sugar phosphate isomerase/epimerase n=1 Tax=Phytoactinopolyspora halotolerans TaxID=1981512 RepID=A0A6L9SCZ8_9ACTN|nr:sugar phosphate isomerase/epimerase family protein [Phytoactinopolyspora halotolerans]NEE01910.1 sugar phosphate isomerase/epimerase [Phytoactinopolyspora halotolerans]
MTWPLAVSTLGMPGALIGEVIDVAASAGCVALELRAGEGQLAHVGMSSAERAELRGCLDEAGLGVLAVCSYVKLCAAGDDDAVVDDITEHVRLAADLGAGGVRLFPGAENDAGAVAEERGRRRLEAAVPTAADSGVRLLVETHDSHRTGEDVARLVAPLVQDVAGDHPRYIGAIWDIVHSWAAGESPEASAASLDGLLAYVQVKDAVLADGRPEPVLPGTGHVPLGEITGVLDRRRYAGVLSLEWEKAWHPDLPEARDALAAVRDWLAATASAGPG